MGNLECKSVEYGVQGRGVIQPDGTFVLGTYSTADGLVAGKHRVVLSQMILLEDARFIGHQTKHEDNSHTGFVHSRYSRYESSDLQFTVVAGPENIVELTVESSEVQRSARR